MAVCPNLFVVPECLDDLPAGKVEKKKDLIASQTNAPSP